jgi:hypothetical protein
MKRYDGSNRPVPKPRKNIKKKGQTNVRMSFNHYAKILFKKDISPFSFDAYLDLFERS